MHDFPHDALVRAVPYGISEVNGNRGSVYVGSSADTPEFAVAAIARWWEEEGRRRFPQANQLLILADAGGSNGCRPRSFKQQLQEQVSDRYGRCVVYQEWWHQQPDGDARLQARLQHVAPASWQQVRQETRHCH